MYVAQSLQLNWIIVLVMDSKCDRTAMKRPHLKGFRVRQTAFSCRDSRNMERNWHIEVVLPYRDGNRILNPWF